jgi:GNAT superfamily N-acetyltransferase
VVSVPVASREGVAEHVVLRDGSTILIGPLEPGDAAANESWFLALQPETRYARFFASLKRLDARTLAELTQVDHRRHEALAAMAPDGVTVGIARYIRLANPEEAEVAATVVDGWQGRGIGGLLLTRLARKARAAGIRALRGTCLATNQAAIRLLTRLGPTTISPPDAGVVEVRVVLSGEEPSRP